MASSTIASLMVKIGGDISDLEKKLSRASRKMQDAGKQMQAIGKTMTASITAPLAAVGGMALKTSADFESLQQSMNTLNGSVEEGTRNFERLQEFSATTPFQLNELAEAQNMLQGFGQSADDAFESVSMIGDIAAVAEGDIKGIGIAFGQAAAEGRLMTRDVRQLINQGVPAIKLLADTMGVAQSEVLDLASQGEISFEILQQAFREATSEGGMFANGMEKQAQTLAGRFSTMKDNINLALGSIGDTMSGLAKDVMDWVIDLAQAFRELDDATKRMITTAGLLVAAIGPAVFILGKLLTVLGALLSPVALVVAAIAGLIVIGKGLYDNWEVIATQMDMIFSGIEVAAWTMVDGTMQGMTNMADGILRILSNMAGAIQPSLVAPMEVARAKIQAANEGISESLQQSKNDFEESGKAAFMAKANMTSLSDSFWSITDAIQQGVGKGLEFLTQQLFGVKNAADQAALAIQRLNDQRASTGQPDDQISFGGYVDDVDDYISRLNDIPSPREAVLGDDPGFFERFADGFARAGEQASLMGDAVTTAFQSMSDEGIDSLGKLLQVTVNTARQIISAEIAKGVAAAVRGALTNVPFPLNIAAAASAGAAAAGLFNSVVPKLAEGGLAFGPTMAVVGDNIGARTDPEVISPLSKLKDMIGGTQRVQVDGKIRGDTIHLANIRGQNKFR